MGSVRDLMHPEMFDQKDLWRKPEVPFVWPVWFYPGKNTPQTLKDHVARGLHPFGWKLGSDLSSCRTCLQVQYRDTKFKKCGLMKSTHGAATDVKLKWRGCEHWDEGNTP